MEILDIQCIKHSNDNVEEYHSAAMPFYKNGHWMMLKKIEKQTLVEESYLLISQDDNKKGITS